MNVSPDKSLLNLFHNHDQAHTDNVSTISSSEKNIDLFDDLNDCQSRNLLTTESVDHSLKVHRQTISPRKSAYRRGESVSRSAMSLHPLYNAEKQE